ncbi:hypothetical protein E2C01_071549 [Portunus trituberculatus]|uniref:Nucleic-acid-binding protein from transposon X-element n=1 Tax=Portunus trituberculatus TaxID=210409 RepID=A0A5B7I8H4_PORTR|nr:hypothetical protein [Portunus trituberculatus]
MIYENSPEEIMEEIERAQGWAKVAEVFKFPRSSTIKITFRSNEMSQKATTCGILMFNMSVPPNQIRQEIYIPIISCNRCYVVESHTTNQCPQPATYKRCSECASGDHTFRDCPTQDKKCINCGGPHSARAMRCPIRKEALREKEEQLRKNRTRPDISFAKATQASAPADPIGHSLTGLMCVLHAHLVNSARPGSFQDTLKESLRLNGLPQVRLPPDPPSLAILRAITGVADLVKATVQVNSPPASANDDIPDPKPHTTDPEEKNPAAAPTNATPLEMTRPNKSTDSPPSTDEDDEDEDDEETNIQVTIFKKNSDTWPKAFTYNHLKSGIKEERYKVIHTGGDEDNERVREWIKNTKGSLQHLCQTVTEEDFSAIKTGSIPRRSSARRRTTAPRQTQ